MAAALAAAGSEAAGAVLYVSLEPCAHQSPRGPACADLVALSALARVVIAVGQVLVVLAADRCRLHRLGGLGAFVGRIELLFHVRRIKMEPLFLLRVQI